MAAMLDVAVSTPRLNSSSVFIASESSPSSPRDVQRSAFTSAAPDSGSEC
jgi:hypothetical protein